MIAATIFPGTPRGTVKIPASKSLAHRAVICAALANGKSHLTNLTRSNDINATLSGMAALGAQINAVSEDEVIITGQGKPTASALLTVDCGESGSTLRFFIPIFALTGQKVRFICHGRLPQRPQSVYQQIFAEQGLHFAPFADDEGAGWELQGSLQPGNFTLAGDVSSQFISGLLFALPLLDGDSTIHIQPPFESRSYVELTLATLRNFGVTATWQDNFTLLIPGNQQYQPSAQQIEGDFSQLAFWAVLGAINNEVTLCGVNHNSAQGDRKIIEIIRQMQGEVEETADGYICRPGRLQAAAVDLADCPDLGPILTVLAAFAEGETRLYNAGRLRIKESDRIADVECELARFGISTHSTQNELFISGGNADLTADAPCQAHTDHRIVMALSVLATVCSRPTVIHNAEAINKSYPNFFQDLQNLGIKVELTNVK